MDVRLSGDSDGSFGDKDDYPAPEGLKTLHDLLEINKMKYEPDFK